MKIKLHDRVIVQPASGVHIDACIRPYIGRIGAVTRVAPPGVGFPHYVLFDNGQIYQFTRSELDFTAPQLLVNKWRKGRGRIKGGRQSDL